MVRWIVLDNSQAQMAIVDQAVGRWPGAGLTLTPFTLAEIALTDVALVELDLRPGGTSALPDLVRAAGGRVRVGLEQRDIHARVLGATEDGIRSIEPFLDDPGVAEVVISVDAARSIKDEHEQKTARLRMAAENARCRLAEAQVGTLSSFAEAEEAFASSPDSFLAMLVVNTLTDGGQATGRVADPRALYGAVMGNPYLGRFWRVWLGYVLSISKLWNQNALRGRSTGYLPRGGDVVDLSLLQYADDGDVVLTGDRRLKDLAAVVDPQQRVRVGTLADLA